MREINRNSPPKTIIEGSKTILPRESQEVSEELEARRVAYTEVTRHMRESKTSLKAGIGVLKLGEPIPLAPEGVGVTHGEGDAWALGTQEEQDALHAHLKKISDATHPGFRGFPADPSGRLQRNSEALNNMQGIDSPLKA